MVELLSRPWQDKLADLLADSERSLLIATPYIKRDAARWLLDQMKGREQRHRIATTVITDLSPDSVLSASLDIDALLLFGEVFQQVTIFDVNRLHAKVYVADQRRAIITSGNLTSSALLSNYEYGVVVTDARTAKRVHIDLENYAKAGRQVVPDELARLNELSRDYCGQYQRAAARSGTEVRLELTREWDKIAADFGVPPELHEMGSVRFKGPILDVLASRGPLTTRELCLAIQGSWPHLCDNTLMRVAKDGTRKRQWRHDIHTAQETLQRAGLLRRDGKGLWHIEGGGQ